MIPRRNSWPVLGGIPVEMSEEILGEISAGTLRKNPRAGVFRSCTAVHHEALTSAPRYFKSFALTSESISNLMKNLSNK